MRQPSYRYIGSLYLLGLAALLSTPSLFTSPQLNGLYDAVMPAPLLWNSDAGNERDRTIPPRLLAKAPANIDATVDVGTIVDAEEAIALIAEGRILYEGADDRTTTISNNSDFTHVSLIDAAAISLENGDILEATLTDFSMVEMTGSSRISHAELSGESTLTLNDESSVSHLTLTDYSTVEISENSRVAHLTLANSASSRIFDGTFSTINLMGQSEAHIWGMNIEGGSFVTRDIAVMDSTVTLEPGATLNLYVRSVDFADGRLFGRWKDGTPFDFTVVMSDPARSLATVPSELPDEVIFHAVKGP
ncbi:MAG: hypothetical protein AAGL17_05835 [Cyanobacteria bacterium J06576_12]